MTDPVDGAGGRRDSLDLTRDMNADTRSKPMSSGTGRVLYEESVADALIADLASR
jgi:hypothetical protein